MNLTIDVQYSGFFSSACLNHAKYLMVIIQVSDSKALPHLYVYQIGQFK